MALVRSLSSGISALRAFQDTLDVISNNIANVNTTGYKTSKVSFRDAISQTVKGDTAPSGNFGGTNPYQIGLGTSIGAIDMQFTQGAIETTQIPTNMAIEGDGFFIVRTPQGNRYTRDGSFRLDADTYLVTANGDFVQGWQADSNGNVNTTAAVGDLQIPVGIMSISRPTSSILYGGNLDASQAVGYNYGSTVRQYDSLGIGHDLTLNFQKTGVNQWTWTITSTDPSITTINPPNGVLTFNGTGQVIAGGTPTVNFAYNNGANAQAIVFDFNALTQLGAESDLSVTNQDGLQKGTLYDFNISKDGKIRGYFTNGLTQLIGQVALATFSNPQGLRRQGNSLYNISTNSGLARVGTAGTGGRGEIIAGALEASNVDLTEEFSRMIVAQRAFQANIRTITTTNTVLGDLVSIIR